LETQPGLERLVLETDRQSGKDLTADNIREGMEKGEEEREEEALMLETLLQRVQATLLSIYKLQAVRAPKKNKEGVEAAGPGPLVKNLYADSLKIVEKSAVNILGLMQEISKQMGKIRAQ
jgi:hypothetical protein